jgi:hypothetical protein
LINTTLTGCGAFAEIVIALPFKSCSGIFCKAVLQTHAVSEVTSWRPQDDSGAFVVVIGATVLPGIFLLLLWFFPKSIARGLLPHSTDAPTQTLSYQLWFTLGTTLLGLWFVASSITPILRNLSVMYVFRPKLINPEDVRSLRVGILYYAVEMVIGLCLLFGSTGIRKLIWRIRNVGP